MPWKDLSLVQQRKAFIDEYLEQLDSVSELCRRFSVSRKTAYKWIDRFLAGCELTDRSRRPHSSPSATAKTLEEAIVAARKDRPRWGPKKLRAMLLRAHPGIELPSISTFAAIFKRHGLVVPRRRRRRTPPSSNPLSGATHPNALWCIDFKGDFLVGKSRCYPLTVTDAHSRFLLGCIALPNTRFEGVRRALVTLFQTFGLPDAIRSDNGSPFASKAPAGLSELSAWWIKLGINMSASSPVSLSRMAATSVCISPSNSPPPLRLLVPEKPSSVPLTAFAWSTTSSDLTKRSDSASLRTSTAAHRASCPNPIGDATTTIPLSTNAPASAPPAISLGMTDPSLSLPL